MDSASEEGKKEKGEDTVSWIAWGKTDGLVEVCSRNVHGVAQVVPHPAAVAVSGGAMSPVKNWRNSGSVAAVASERPMSCKREELT